MATENPKLADLDRRLAEKWLSGIWRIPAGARPRDPHTRVEPHLWKWADIYGALVSARDEVDIERGTAERRTLRLVNPGIKDTEMTTHTMMFAFQLIQPGEVAPPHRHTMAAIRFILQGQGGYTNVGGQKLVMEDGDLILTPQWFWHEHAHEGAEPMVWIDGLDVPFVQSLQVISFEPYPEERMDARVSRHEPAHYGMARPFTTGDAEPEAPLHYRWRDIYPALKALEPEKPHPYDGYALEYVNPLTGGPTLPTLSCCLQLLRPGQRTQSHRHTSTVIYHAFRGSGTSVINGRAFEWQKGDTFVVPLWHWHEHANSSASEEAILFSMNDSPVLKPFGLCREEGAGESHLGM
jgi:gentisate 1,2-dioxygenase